MTKLSYGEDHLQTLPYMIHVVFHILSPSSPVTCLGGSAIPSKRELLKTMNGSGISRYWEISSEAFSGDSQLAFSSVVNATALG